MYELPNKLQNRRIKQGFTLIELLVVMAIIALLLAILLPALRIARTRAKSVPCMNNLGQIALAWHMYLDDNEGFFFQGVNHNYDFGGWQGKKTNALYRPLNAYMKNKLSTEIETENDARVFHCPADDGAEDYPGTAYAHFGNSYQTNTMLIGPSQLPTASWIAEPYRSIYTEINKYLKKLNRQQVSQPQLLLLVGDHNWVGQSDPVNTVYCGGGWHGKLHHYNLAFLDSHVESVRIGKGLLVVPGQYRIQPFMKLDNLVLELEELPCPCGKE
jgi:prepilin-type N-terminal cleavage/methylation domain-containing protein